MFHSCLSWAFHEYHARYCFGLCSLALVTLEPQPLGEAHRPDSEEATQPSELKLA